MDAIGKLLLTKAEAANLLSISERTLEREISVGRFPKPLKIGRSCRIPASDLNDYVASLRSPEGRNHFVDTLSKAGPMKADLDVLQMIQDRFPQSVKKPVSDK